MTLTNKQILLIISGGIAAYKSLELIRLLKKDGLTVRAILTRGGAEFVTPLSVSALCEHPVYTDLWSLKDESEMGHIRLSREADLILIVPCSANMITKMAQGVADDLASTCLLASRTPLAIAPAMNVEMWHNPSTQNNLNTLAGRGVHFIGPMVGDMACGETGMGRMIEAADIFAWIQNYFAQGNALTGKYILVTAGSTIEPLDPVRYLSNFSSGKQGYAIATALQQAGAHVTLISGKADLRAPPEVNFISVQTADEMNEAVMNSLRAKPYDVAICTAAVADFKPIKTSAQKIKKTDDDTLTITLTKNPDIVRGICASPHRPALVIGFAAETENLLDHARQKRERKQCDWMVANLVGQTDNHVFGRDENAATLITATHETTWPQCSKIQIAQKLVAEISNYFSKDKGLNNVKQFRT